MFTFGQPVDLTIETGQLKLALAVALEDEATGVRPS